jgi:hypothetical protein
MVPSINPNLDFSSGPSQATQGPTTQTGTYRFEAPQFGSDYTTPAAIVAGAVLIGFLGYVWMRKGK